MSNEARTIQGLEMRLQGAARRNVGFNTMAISPDKRDKFDECDGIDGLTQMRHGSYERRSREAAQITKEEIQARSALPEIGGRV